MENINISKRTFTAGDIDSELQSKLLKHLYSVLSNNKKSPDDVFNEDLCEDILNDTYMLFHLLTNTKDSESEFSKILQNSDEVFYLPSLAEVIDESLDVPQCILLEKHYIIRMWMNYGKSEKKNLFQNDKATVIEVGQNEFNHINYSSGWVIKRMRETAKKAKVLQLLVSEDQHWEPVDRDIVFGIIKKISTEVNTSGKYLIIPAEGLCNFFIRLHSFVDGFLFDKSRKNLNVHSKYIILHVIQKTLTNKSLRDEWFTICGNENKVAVLYCFKQAITFFMKIKQKIVLKQLNLKPKKKSVALRQSIKSNMNNNKKNLKKEIPIIADLKSKDPLLVAQSLTKIKLSSSKEFIIQKLCHNDLTRIFKALSLPSNSHKSKIIRWGLLVDWLSKQECVEIKHPEQLC